MPKTVVEPETNTEETDSPYRPPFLRITGSYPVSDDEYTQLAVELNLGDQDADLVAIDADGDGNALRSWMTSFVTEVLRELRAGPPVAVVLGGQIRELFAAAASNREQGDTVPAGTEGGV